MTGQEHGAGGPYVRGCWVHALNFGAFQLLSLGGFCCVCGLWFSGDSTRLPKTCCSQRAPVLASHAVAHRQAHRDTLRAFRALGGCQHCTLFLLGHQSRVFWHQIHTQHWALGR